MEYYSAIKKSEIVSFATIWIGLETVILSCEISQTKKDKYHIISLKCGVLKNDTNGLIYITDTGSQT